MDFIKLKLVEYGFAIVVAPMAALAFQLLKRYSKWVDDLPAWPKRAFVAVTVTVFMTLGAITGVDFGITPDTETVDFLTNIDTGTLKVLVSTGLAYLLHALKKTVKF